MRIRRELRDDELDVSHRIVFPEVPSLLGPYRMAHASQPQSRSDHELFTYSRVLLIIFARSFTFTQPSHLSCRYEVRSIDSGNRLHGDCDCYCSIDPCSASRVTGIKLLEAPDGFDE